MKWIPAGWATALVACSGPSFDDYTFEAEPVRLHDAWVFRYAGVPGLMMDGRHWGEVSVEADCLRVGGHLVVWHGTHLPAVEEALAQLDNDDTVAIGVGGGFAEAEAPEVLGLCDAERIFYASDDEIELLPAR